MFARTHAPATICVSIYATILTQSCPDTTPDLCNKQTNEENDDKLMDKKVGDKCAL